MVRSTTRAISVFAALVAALVLMAGVLAFGAGQAQAKVVTLENAKGTINTVIANDFIIASTASEKPSKLKVTGKEFGSVKAGPGYLSISPKGIGTIKVQYRFKGKVHKVNVKVLALGNADGTVVASLGTIRSTLILEPKAKGKLTGVKVGNEKVLYVDKLEGPKPALNISPVKKGKSKLSYTFKGKAHSLTFKVRKYANPLASFKVGGGQYKSAFDNRNEEIVDATWKFKGAVNVKMAAGWQLKSIAVDGKKVKNGKKMPKSFREVDVVVVNKKTKVAESLHLEVEAQDSADEI